MDHTQTVIREWQRLESLLRKENVGCVRLDGHSLTIPDVVAVSRHNLLTDIDPAAVESMLFSYKTLEDKIRDGEIIYGVNTGFGGSADLRTTKLAELQRAVVRELHYGVLPPGERDHRAPPLEASLASHQHDAVDDTEIEISYLPRSWTRAAILIRINSLISGNSAVRPVIVERMQDLLKHDITPMIPMRGSISASGDLSPLSYICGAIQGKSTIRVLSKDPQLQYTNDAFIKYGLEPLMIQAKEGLAMTNGTTVSAAVAALALNDAHTLAVMAQILTAMSVEALHGTVESFHPFFSETRPHPGQIESARNILGFLEGSHLTRVNTGANATLRQDRYSLRTVPQWLGPILEDLVLAHQQISIECNSVTDNPLVTPDGEFLHGGNFQAKAVTSAMEKVRQGLQGIGRMIFTQCTELTNPVTNRGLPPNLVAEDPSASLIFKGTDLFIAALTAELGFLASPVNHVQTAEQGNQSLNSLALISARYTHTAIGVLSQLMAIHLIAVCQALDLRALHIQFLEMYRPHFTELVGEHYAASCLDKASGNDEALLTADSGRADHPTALTNGVKLTNGVTHVATDQTTAAALDEMPGPETILSDNPIVSANLPNGSTLNGSAHNDSAPNGSSHNVLKKTESATLEKLADSLWSQLLVSFDTTTSMDVADRFTAIAKSLRPILLEHGTLNKATDFVARLERFVDALSGSMSDTWCAHRDAYLAHGDAAPVLGSASKAMYTFVRRSLNVPLLATKDLSTPRTDEIRSGMGVHGSQAPTVGAYNSAVYRALRDGTLGKVAVDILQATVQGQKST